MSLYQERIRETVAAMGRIGVEPRHVEGWMRLEYSTLDHLGGARWHRAVREAVECIDASTPYQNEALAASYGLTDPPPPAGHHAAWCDVFNVEAAGPCPCSCGDKL